MELRTRADAVTSALHCRGCDLDDVKPLMVVAHGRVATPDLAGDSLCPADQDLEPSTPRSMGILEPVRCPRVPMVKPLGLP